MKRDLGKPAEKGPLNASPAEQKSQDVFSTLREKSARDVLNLTLKKGRSGTYKAEDVEAYCQSMQSQFNSTESTYNDYVKSLYQQIDKLKGELDAKSNGKSPDVAVELQVRAVETEAAAQIQAVKAEKQQLAQQLAEAQHQTCSLRDQITAQAKEIRSLREANLALQNKLSQKSFEPAAPAAVKAEIDALRKSLSEQTDRESKLREELEETRVQLSQAQTRLAQVRTQYESAQVQISSLRTENEESQRAYDALSAEMDKRQSEFTALHEKLAEMQQINDMLYNKNKALNNSIEAAATEKANTMLASSSFRARSQNMNNVELQELRAQNQALEKDKQAALQLAKAREASLAAQKALLDEQSVRFSQLLAQTQEQGSRIAMQDAALKELQTQIVALSESQSSRRDLQTEALLRAMQEDNQMLAASVRTLTDEKADLTRQLNSIRESFHSALRLNGEEYLADDRLMQLVESERTRLDQLVRQSWKTGLWTEINSIVM